jgi:P-type Cu2+ transporter
MAEAQLVRSAPIFAAKGPADARLATMTLAVENMNCGGCMRKIERVLNAQGPVVAARANLSTKRATVTFDPARLSAAKLIAILDDAGFTAAEFAASDTSAEDKLNRAFLGRLGVAGFAAMNVMLLSVSVWSGRESMDPATANLFHWISALIAIPTVAYSGQPFFSSAWRGLRAWRVTMDVPISLAILLSAAMSLVQTMRGGHEVYFDACVSLLFFLLIGRFLDLRMRLRAQGAAQNLLRMRSQTATIISAGGAAETVPTAALMPDDLLLVATGERIPADGVVLGGGSQVDESLLTGESLPRALGSGDEIYAGTINLGIPLEMRVTKIEKDTVLAEMTALMETAEQVRGRYVRLADRAARLYGPGVHLLALTTFTGWMAAGAGWEFSLLTAIAVLIITCPCALALAVPAVQVAASSRLFASGVLVKAADGLERISEIDTVVFDKTGTLTHGQPALLDADTYDADILRAAGTLAVASRHPYARAVVAAAKLRFGAVERAEGVEETPGAGLKRATAEGAERLGSAEWCCVETARTGEASLWYCRPGAAPVAFAFADTIRPDAAETVRALLAAGLAVELLSGDRIEAVRPVANALGIANWRAACRPRDKIARLDELKRAGRRVLMAGDGLNDAPALAAAHASLSPSSAADVSQMTSDAVFQGQSLAPVIELIATARRAQRMAFENFAIAGVYNVFFVPIAMAGFVTPLVAALAMSTSSILVTANALRLRGATPRMKP